MLNGVDGRAMSHSVVHMHAGFLFCFVCARRVVPSPVSTSSPYKMSLAVHSNRINRQCPSRVGERGFFRPRPARGVAGRPTSPPLARWHVHATADEVNEVEETDEMNQPTTSSVENGIIEQDESVYIEIGIVGPPHGVRGEFKVQSLTDWPEQRLGQKGTRYLRPPESTFHMARLQTEEANRVTKVTLMRGQASVYKGREVYICKIKGINTPEEARAIHGHTLLVHKSARDELEDEDEFYVQELVGLRVELLETGEEVGTVQDIMDGTGTHDVLQIVNEAGQAILLPFVKEMVPEVDMDAGVLRATPPEGLLEVYTREIKKNSSEKRRRRPKKKL